MSKSKNDLPSQSMILRGADCNINYFGNKDPDPSFSVIIPVYNVDQYLGEFLASIDAMLAFQKVSVEFFFIDDASTDKSVEMILEWANKLDGHYCEVIALSSPSGAPGLPRNIGIERACGEYLCFWDPDDMVLPECLANFTFALDRYGKKDIVLTDYLILEEARQGHGKKSFEAAEWFPIFQTSAVIEFNLDQYINLLRRGPTIWAKAFKRRLVKDNSILFPEGIFGQDAVFNVKALFNSKNTIVLPLRQYIYRKRDDNGSSITQNFTPKYFMDFAETRKLIFQVIGDKYAGMVTQDFNFIANKFRIAISRKDFSFKDLKAIFGALSEFSHLWTAPIAIKGKFAGVLLFLIHKPPCFSLSLISILARFFYLRSLVIKLI